VVWWLVNSCESESFVVLVIEYFGICADGCLAVVEVMFIMCF